MICGGCAAAADDPGEFGHCDDPRWCDCQHKDRVAWVTTMDTTEGSGS